MKIAILAVSLSWAVTACATGVADAIDPLSEPSTQVAVDASGPLDGRATSANDAATAEGQDGAVPEVDSAAPPEDSAAPMDVGAPLDASAPEDANPAPKDAGGATCPAGFAAPSTFASCTACQTGSHTCQANGCYNGYFCNTTTDKCSAPPANCP